MKVTASDLTSLAQDVADLTAAVAEAARLEAYYHAQALAATTRATQASEERMTAAYGLDVTLGELAAAATQMNEDLE